MAASDVGSAAALRRAAIRAMHAYSVHHTQPWRFEVRPGRLDLLVDTEHRLTALDPSARQLHVSLGSAAFAVRAALAAAGVRADVDLAPDPMHPDLAAYIAIDDDPDAAPDTAVAALEAGLADRQNTVGELKADELPAGLLAAVEAAVADEAAQLAVVESDTARAKVRALARRSREIQLVDRASRAELHAWTGSVDADVADVAGPDAAETGAPLALVLGGRRDDRAHWLRTGSALQRAMALIAPVGCAVAPDAAVVEVLATRAELRKDLGLTWQPHVVLFVGAGAIPAEPRRRRLVDVLFESL